METSDRPVAARRILVAEDIAINREILASVLGDEGPELVFAQDGAEALALVQASAFDLVLMDVQMPVMDGVEATMRIRALEGPVRTIAILALSANLKPQERQRYLDAGMTDCLVKPYDWEQLAAAIDRHGAHAPVRADNAGQVEATGAGEASLVRPEILARLQRATGPDQLRMMVRMGIDAYELYCDAMLDPAAGPAEVGRDAHKLKGSAGTFGFARLSAVAGRIELAVDAGLNTGELLQELKSAITATRAELERMGALPD
ncbi:MAG: hypothetical protein NVS3B2_16350 [Ramlibacter sp.]